jgi:hypothetical protein
MCDVLLRLPLSVFVKVVNVSVKINGIEDYLVRRLVWSQS